jgi:hypothetical protein
LVASIGSTRRLLQGGGVRRTPETARVHRKLPVIEGSFPIRIGKLTTTPMPQTAAVENGRTYRPVLDNRRLKEVLGVVPSRTSAEAFEAWRVAHPAATKAS